MAQENLENKVYKENKVAKIFAAFNVISAMSVIGVSAFCPEAMEVMKEHYNTGIAIGMYFLLAVPCSVIYLGACADRKKQAEENAKKYTNHN